MPKKRFMKKRPRGKKNYRKGNKSSQQKIIANYGMNNVFPRQYVCKLKYSVTVPISSGLISRDNVFRINSCYDPDFTSITGGQPRYFDQLSGIYAGYRVLGSKIRVRYMPNDATTPGQTHWLAVVANNDSTSFNNSLYEVMAERPLCKTSINNIYGKRTDITMYQSVNAVKGVNKSTIRNDDRYQANIGADPEAAGYWHCVVGTLNSASTTINGIMLVDITYYTQFERPIVPGSS